MLKLTVAHLLLLGSFFFLIHEGLASESIKESMLQDLEVAKYSLSVKYAPYEWKRDYFGWTLEQAFNDAKTKLLDTKDLSFKEYHQIFKGFLSTTRDYHVRSQFYSTEMAFFPLTVKQVNGSYYITSFETEFSLSGDEIAFEFEGYDEESFAKALTALNPQIGDEVVAINGIAIQELIEKLIDDDLGGDRTPTGYAIAERLIFRRFGKYGHEVPSGSFELTIRHDGNTVSGTIPWLHIPEWVRERTNEQKIESSLMAASHLLKLQDSKKLSFQTVAKLLTKDFSVEFAKDILEKHTERDPVEGEEENEDCRIKGFLPPLGTIVWETPINRDTYAYLYETIDGKRYGYLYLSSFSYGDVEAEKLINEIAEALQIFNLEADALVLDICNNPGGNLIFTYGVCQMLIDYPLQLPKFQQMLIAEDVYDYAFAYNLLKNLFATEEGAKEELWDGFLMGEKQKRQVCNFAHQMIEQWEKEQKLTPPDYILGIDAIDPHPTTRFAKPILLLINELDFSCADFFPAILQDNKRAMLFGNKTAGAGGSVKRYTHTSRFGVQGYSLTGSIAYRTNGKVIENLGVTPDIPYEITLRDIRENYADYIEAVNRSVRSLIKD